MPRVHRLGAIDFLLKLCREGSCIASISVTAVPAARPGPGPAGSPALAVPVSDNRDGPSPTADTHWQSLALPHGP